MLPVITVPMATHYAVTNLFYDSLDSHFGLGCLVVGDGEVKSNNDEDGEEEEEESSRDEQRLLEQQHPIEVVRELQSNRG